MIFVLNITLFSPINRILEERDRQTLGKSGEAQRILRQVSSNLEQYEHVLREARVKGYHLLEEERATAIRKRQDLLNSLREDLQVSIQEQKHLIQMQAAQARLKLEEDCHYIAGDVSDQILRRPLNGQGKRDVNLSF